MGTLAFVILIGPAVEGSFWLLARSPLVEREATQTVLGPPAECQGTPAVSYRGLAQSARASFAEPAPVGGLRVTTVAASGGEGYPRGDDQRPEPHSCRSRIRTYSGIDRPDVRAGVRGHVRRASALDPARWLPYYLPHWSSRRTFLRRGTHVGGGTLRLLIEEGSAGVVP